VNPTSKPDSVQKTARNHRLYLLPQIKVVSVKNGVKIADQCYVANSFFHRLRGLIGTRSLKEGEGLLITDCNNIHTWWMSIAIDVIFMRNVAKDSERFIITSTAENVVPWRLLPILDSRAQQTLELPAGSLKRCAVRAGDELCLS
jgi:uncharacterized protein